LKFGKVDGITYDWVTLSARLMSDIVDGERDIAGVANSGCGFSGVVLLALTFFCFVFFDFFCSEFTSFLFVTSSPFDTTLALRFSFFLPLDKIGTCISEINFAFPYVLAGVQVR
jgi:hypothetical protein